MEILVVIGIIGILIAISVSSYSAIQKRSRDSRRMGDLKAIQNAFEQYYTDNLSKYPDGVSYTTLTTYFSGSVPTDPKTGCYYKQTSFLPTGYLVGADLEVDGTFGCTTPCDAGTAGNGCTNNYTVKNLQ